MWKGNRDGISSTLYFSVTKLFASGFFPKFDSHLFCSQLRLYRNHCCFLCDDTVKMSLCFIAGDLSDGSPCLEGPRRPLALWTCSCCVWRTLGAAMWYFLLSGKLRDGTWTSHPWNPGEGGSTGWHVAWSGRHAELTSWGFMFSNEVEQHSWQHIAYLSLI